MEGRNEGVFVNLGDLKEAIFDVNCQIKRVNKTGELVIWLCNLLFICLLGEAERLIPTKDSYDRCFLRGIHFFISSPFLSIYI